MKKMKFNKFFVVSIILIGSIFLTSTVVADTKPEYIIEDPCEGFYPLGDSQIYCGVFQDAAYQIEVPGNWNGDLLMWAHGYRIDFDEYIWVSPPPWQFREWLVENGYAWAASSYSGNDADITVGVKDTKALRMFFQEEIAVPEHVYISGESMGGAVTVISVEQWPNLYDGAMPTCSAVSFNELIDYFWNYYVLINALAGSDASYPIPNDFVTSGDYDILVDQLAAFPGLFPYFINEKGELLKNALEMLSGGERPLFDQGFILMYGILDDFYGINVPQLLIDMDAVGVNGVWLDNWDNIYQLDLNPDLSPEELAFNEDIFRIQRDPQAMHPNGLKNIPVSNGNIKVPVLSLFGIGDLFVPLAQEKSYAQLVASQGSSDLLVQRAIRDIIHCSYTKTEYAEAFSDLVNWVETGNKPMGDDILDPDVVSDPNFGCQFTSEDRDYSSDSPLLVIPPCP